MNQIQSHTAPLPESDPAGQMLLSHDMRSTLGRLLGAVHLLEAAGLDKAEASLLSQVKVSAGHMVDLLDSVAGIEAEIPLTNLKAAFARLDEIWSLQARQKGLEFRLDLQAGLPNSLRIPPLDFIRIFNNLIGNAVKFTPQGRITLRAMRGQGGGLEIEVEDSGPGFSDLAKAKLFSLRGRPDDNRESGSGFGLFIARALVEKAGGVIDGKNRDSGGASLRLVFPEDLLMTPAAPDLPKESRIIDLPDLSHLNILLAEDNPTNQLVATQMLEKMKAKVQCADDGVQGLERFEQGDYNLGLIDIEMPRKSGLEMLREIRARSDHKAKVKLLALTAYVLPEHRERILGAGADGIIAKPLRDIAAFGHAILSHVETPAPVARPPLDADSSVGTIEMEVYSGLKEIIGHDSMQELLEKVKTDLSSVQNGLLAGEKAKDCAPLRAQTHILISVAGAIGAVQLQHAAEALNAKAKTNAWDEIIPMVRRCDRGLSDVLEFVKQELAG